MVGPKILALATIEYCSHFQNFVYFALAADAVSQLFFIWPAHFSAASAACCTYILAVVLRPYL